MSTFIGHGTFTWSKTTIEYEYNNHNHYNIYKYIYRHIIIILFCIQCIIFAANKFGFFSVSVSEHMNDVWLRVSRKIIFCVRIGMDWSQKFYFFLRWSLSFTLILSKYSEARKPQQDLCNILIRLTKDTWKSNYRSAARRSLFVRCAKS